jgi:hypothetical protein
MKLVIVVDDARVIVDAVGYDGLDMSQLDPTVHAVQWVGEYGEIEYKTVFADGVITKPNNQIITDIAPYQWAIDAWNVAKAAEEAAIAAAELALAEETAQPEAQNV